jgi:uncharacterized membrane protein YoaK (UPF0700 family)
MKEETPRLFKRQDSKIIETSSSPLTHLHFSLLLLTFAAGWVDAMTFLALGKVFSSFMSGNVLFLGIAAGQHDWDFLMNVLSALMAFGMGGVLAGLSMAGERPSGGPDGLSRSALLLELAVLLIFACLWLAIADVQPNLARRAGLVGTAAFAMGIQAANVLALGIPGVATNALTGTITLIVRRLTLLACGEKPKEEVTTGYLLLLCLGYALSALLVVKSIGSTITPFVPAMVLLVVMIEVSRKSHFLKPPEL